VPFAVARVSMPSNRRALACQTKSQSSSSISYRSSFSTRAGGTLAQECADYRERARLADPEQVAWRYRPRVGRLWETRTSEHQRVLARDGERRDGRYRGNRRNDSLHTLDPPLYFSVLTGIPVPPGGMVRCPFHDDHSPSLHVWAEGWYCHGCHFGGDVYNLAAALWGRDARTDFQELRRELLEVFRP
jgi:hypothetical protein